MSTTLHLLLAGIPPHTLPRNFITREHMLALHRALLEFLIQGTPPDLWQRGCLYHGIPPPPGTHTCPHGCISIATANLLPKGPTRLNPCPPLRAPPVSTTLDTTPKEAPLHSPPFATSSQGQGAADNPQHAPANPKPAEGTERPTTLRMSCPQHQKLSPSAHSLPKRHPQT